MKLVIRRAKREFWISNPKAWEPTRVITTSFLLLIPLQTTKLTATGEIVQDGTSSSKMLPLLQEQGTCKSLRRDNQPGEERCEPSTRDRHFKSSPGEGLALCELSVALFSLSSKNQYLTFSPHSRTPSLGSTVVSPTLRSESSTLAGSVRTSTSSLCASTWFPTSMNS